MATILSGSISAEWREPRRVVLLAVNVVLLAVNSERLDDFVDNDKIAGHAREE